VQAQYGPGRPSTPNLSQERAPSPSNPQGSQSLLVKSTSSNGSLAGKALSIEEQTKIKAKAEMLLNGKDMFKRLEDMIQFFKTKGSKTEKDLIPEIINHVRLFSQNDQVYFF
jgi:hypothetical protein